MAPRPSSRDETVPMRPRSLVWRTMWRVLPSSSSRTDVDRERKCWTRIKFARKASSTGEMGAFGGATFRSPGRSAKRDSESASSVTPSALATPFNASIGFCVAAAINNAARASCGGTAAPLWLRQSLSSARMAASRFASGLTHGSGCFRRSSSSRRVRPEKRSYSSRRTRIQGWSCSARKCGTIAPF